MNNQFFLLINSQSGNFFAVDLLMVFLAELFIHFLFLAAIFMFLFKKNYSGLALLIISCILTYLISYILGLVFFEARPSANQLGRQLINVFDPLSFPSKHASISAAIAANIYFINRKLGYLFLFATLLIGISRIFVGVHYPFDIIAGLFLGLIVAYLVHRAEPAVKLTKGYFIDKH